MEREGVVMGGMPWLLLLVVVVAGCGHREEVEKEGVVRRGRRVWLLLLMVLTNEATAASPW